MTAENRQLYIANVQPNILEYIDQKGKNTITNDETVFHELMHPGQK